MESRSLSLFICATVVYMMMMTMTSSNMCVCVCMNGSSRMYMVVYAQHTNVCVGCDVKGDWKKSVRVPEDLEPARVPVR